MLFRKCCFCWLIAVSLAQLSSFESQRRENHSKSNGDDGSTYRDSSHPDAKYGNASRIKQKKTEKNAKFKGSLFFGYCATQTELYPNNRLRWTDLNRLEGSFGEETAIKKSIQTSVGENYIHKYVCNRDDPRLELYHPMTLHVFVTARSTSMVRNQLRMLATGHNINLNSSSGCRYCRALSTGDKITVILLVTADDNSSEEVESDFDPEIHLPSMYEFPFQLEIIFEYEADSVSENWEFIMRNKYLHLLANDFVWFIDDSVTITDEAVSTILSSIQQDRSYRTLFALSSRSSRSPEQRITAHEDGSFIYFHVRSLKLTNFIIPVAAARLGTFGLQSDGEVWFLTTIQSFITCVDFIDTVTHISSSPTLRYVHNTLDLVYHPKFVDEEVVANTQEHRAHINSNLLTFQPLDQLTAMHDAKAFCSNNHPDALRQGSHLFAPEFCVSYMVLDMLQSMQQRNVLVNGLDSILSQETLMLVREKTWSNPENIVITPLQTSLEFRSACTSTGTRNSHVGWPAMTNIYVINLKHRQDRLHSFFEGWKESNMPICEENFFRVEALHIDYIKGLGCTKSHIAALIHFLQSGKEYGIIFEDDFAFLHSHQSRQLIDGLFDDLSGDIDVFLFSIHYFSNRINLTKDTVVFDESYQHHKYRRVLSSTSAAGYLVSKSFASTLLDNFIESATLLELGVDFQFAILDVRWNRLRASSTWLTYSGDVFSYQAPGYSDNQFELRPYSDAEFLAYENALLCLPLFDRFTREDASHSSSLQWGLVDVLAAAVGDEESDRVVVSLSRHDILAVQLFSISTAITYALNHNISYEIILKKDFKKEEMESNPSDNHHDRDRKKYTPIETLLSSIPMSNTTQKRDKNKLTNHSRHSFHASTGDSYVEIPPPSYFRGLSNSSGSVVIELLGAFRNSLYFQDVRGAMLRIIEASLSSLDKRLINRLFSFIVTNTDSRVKVFVDMTSASDVASDLLPEYYYDVAMRALEKRLSLKTEDIYYVIFTASSKDKEAAKTNRFNPANHYILDGLPDHLRLVLMTQMDSGIISNNLLSWWAAVMLPIAAVYEPHRISGHTISPVIVSPKLWLDNGVDHGEHLLLKEWIVIRNDVLLFKNLNMHGHSRTINVVDSTGV